ncbi:hypothetical protein N9901_02905 [Flavobacteriaceae bacterium]|nr:hypothetical protein [Flavobacteriaceae bacterium]
MKLSKLLKQVYSSLFNNKPKYLQQHEDVLKHRYETMSKYVTLFALDKGRDVVHTDIPIHYAKDIVFGTSKQEVVNKLGKPYIHIDDLTIKGIELFLYKTYIGKLKAKLEFHFHENSLFYFTIRIHNTSDQDLKTVGDILLKKYGITTTSDNLCIQDPNGAVLFSESFMTLKLHYLCKNNPFHLLVKEHMFNKVLHNINNLDAIYRKL